jgi:hypothetical protein
MELCQTDQMDQSLLENKTYESQNLIEFAVIIDENWLKDSFQSMELMLSPLETVQKSQAHCLDILDALKQLNSLIPGLTESENWMEPISLDLP